MPSLTDHLLSKTTSDEYVRATRHPFLEEARKRTLDPQLLAYWLAQDYAYASEGYLPLIRLLLIKASTLLDDTNLPEDRARLERTKSVLEFSVANIDQEVKFFRETSEKFDLDLEGWKEREATRRYLNQMKSVSILGTLEEGLVFLWAMEHVYLNAWTFVASGRDNVGRDERTKNAIDAFANNWSSAEFVRFVNDLRDLVDRLDIGPDTKLWLRAEEQWDTMVRLEIDFWPNIGEEALEASRKST